MQPTGDLWYERAVGTGSKLGITFIGDNAPDLNYGVPLDWGLTDCQVAKYGDTAVVAFTTEDKVQHIAVLE